jgi:signal transduction histidine kinase
VTGTQTWADRSKPASNGLHIIALVVAVVASAIPDGVTADTALAAVVATAAVGAAFLARLPFPERPIREIAIIGVSLVAWALAVGLDGGIESAYTLMPVATIFLAAIGGGIKAATPTAVLATAGVLMAAAVGDTLEVTGNLIRVPAFYALTAIAFSEAQRAINAQSKITEDVLLASDAARSRTASLEATHALLEDLVNVATSPNMNAVATAQDAVRDVNVIYGSVASRIIDRTGTVLATRGSLPSHDPSVSIPIRIDRQVTSTLELWTDGDTPNEDQLTLIRNAVAPVGLAIENNTMLLEVAGIATQQERVRLARELHDDIAPSVASLGLTLDMLLLTDQLDAEQTRNIEASRENVALLVERIRARVQDLRADRSKSLTEFAHGMVADVDADGPTVSVTIDERTPPRPAIAAEIRAMLKESFRNALNHANASVIEIGGRIDEAGGTVTVKDNGRGFDTAASPDERFGLVGLKERAGLIKADVSIESEVGSGTLITISWRDST